LIFKGYFRRSVISEPETVKNDDDRGPQRVIAPRSLAVPAHVSRIAGAVTGRPL